MKKAILNWSGGKDSAFTLWYLRQSKEYEIVWLLTSVNSKYDRISMHGVRVSLLEAQAESLGLPLYKVHVHDQVTMEEYNLLMRETLDFLKKSNIGYSIFGDIFLEDLKRYREEQLARVQMKGVFPIWKKDTSTLSREFVKSGFKAIIVCINSQNLPKSFVGRPYDDAFLNDLPSGVDPCGENGEFHTFVYDGPIFHNPVSVRRGEVVFKNYRSENSAGHPAPSSSNNDNPGFWFCDLLEGET